MCGRYSIVIEGDIAEIFPTDQAPVFLKQGNGAISCEQMRWGFKKWDGSGAIINARSETLQTKSMFAGLLKTGRCVVPASGYYEWKKVNRERIKHSIKARDADQLFMAGLYREGADGREFVIITKPPCEAVADIHNRMPVMLQEVQIEQWLSGKMVPDDLVKMDVDMVAKPCDNENIQMSLF